jgi:(heptosyl)LPS beta-1,4-glucosyltransferase
MSAAHLTAVILTRNEKDFIEACIDSLTWTDQIVVFDSGSQDGTQALARDRGARVIEHPFTDFASQRNAALEQIESDWIFFVDADERATPELADEVRSVIDSRPEVGWWTPRHNYIVGRRIMHAGWYPDYQLRLLRRDRARYDPTRKVHEVVMLEGDEGYLRNVLIHYNYDTWGEFIEKQRHYLTFDARIQVEAGVRPRPWTYVMQPLREFRRRYVTLRGYRDGWHGLVLSLLMAYTAFLTTVEVARLRRQADVTPPA